jgi:hypothetical protein
MENLFSRMTLIIIGFVNAGTGIGWPTVAFYDMSAII